MPASLAVPPPNASTTSISVAIAYKAHSVASTGVNAGRRGDLKAARRVRKSGESCRSGMERRSPGPPGRWAVRAGVIRQGNQIQRVEIEEREKRDASGRDETAGGARSDGAQSCDAERDFGGEDGRSGNSPTKSRYPIPSRADSRERAGRARTSARSRPGCANRGRREAEGHADARRAR